MYVLNIHNMPKIFWGAWPLTILERPNCSKVLVPLSKLSVSKNVWFTNARLGPLDFIRSEMLKMGMGGSGPSGKQPLGSTISGAGPPLDPPHGHPFSDPHQAWYRLKINAGSVRARLFLQLDFSAQLAHFHCQNPAGNVPLNLWTRDVFIV